MSSSFIIESDLHSSERLPSNFSSSKSPWKHTSAALALRDHPLFVVRATEYFESYLERTKLSLKRAQLLVRAYSLTIDDVLNLDEPFWAMHGHLSYPLDGAAGTLATIQVNLVSGTIANYVSRQPSLQPLVDELLNFGILGHYLLTEVGHGLDAINLETVAVSDGAGGFILNTPSPQAAKMMPPTSPLGIPAIAVVFAQLVENGKDLGIRQFLVPITDGKSMAKGVTSRLLPPRGGSHPLNHSITSFHNVYLPASALLGSPLPLPSTRNANRDNFLQLTFRVAIGAMALSTPGILSLERSAFIVGSYSRLRTVGTPGKANSIISFRTQHQPIIVAFALSSVLTQLHRVCVKVFQDPDEDPRVKHAYATLAKSTICHAAMGSAFELSERCGARGLYEINGPSSDFANLRGITIAEGDLLGLSIRLTAELLLGRYSVHEATNPDSLLALHEAGLYDEARLHLVSSDHRGATFQRDLLPRCESMVRAIGHRIAWEAAIAAGVDPILIDVFRNWAIKYDSGWYVQHADLDMNRQREMESLAIDKALPKLDAWISNSWAREWASDIPIVTQRNWDSYVDSLPLYTEDSPHPIMAHL
ncbi:acyl-CoA dehydrogenase NM domain-like protein [Flagelloscypha sp. PMI_526]|nr:acyl-CoA dehydrogenase NM domain-like protein [Flagelloscypha sp. PMI_526]